MADDADRLAGLTAATALLLAALPDEPMPVPSILRGIGWRRRSKPVGRNTMSRGMRVLAMLGFGLDLSRRCAVTGVTADLAYVSPRTGRAVSRAVAAPYRDKLLPLPGFLWRDSPAARRDIAAGLALTGYFLLHHLLEPHGRQLPEARERLAERMRRPERGYNRAQ